MSIKKIKTSIKNGKLIIEIPLSEVVAGSRAVTRVTRITGARALTGNDRT